MHTFTALVTFAALQIALAACTQETGYSPPREIRTAPTRATHAAPAAAPTPRPAIAPGEQARPPALAAAESTAEAMADAAYRIAALDGQIKELGPRADSKALAAEKARLEKQLHEYLGSPPAGK